MAGVKTIFNYMGNKSSMVETLVSSQPPHRVYVEVFGGTMAYLLNKPKSEIEIYNDFNSHLTNLHEIIRTRKNDFISEVKKLYISEDTYKRFYLEPTVEGNELESAVRYFYIMCLCHLGKFTGGFKVIPQVSYVNTFENKIEIIENIYRRIKNVIITNKSYDKIITANNKEDTYIYCDPPYVSSETYYEKLAGSFNESEHIKLRDILKAHKGTWMLSYENSDLVRDLYSEYHFISLSKYRQSKGQDAEEIIVTNYVPSNTLFSMSKQLF